MFCLGEWRLGKPEPQGPDRLFASNRQIRKEQELLAAFLHSGLQTVVRAPGLLKNYHGDG